MASCLNTSIVVKINTSRVSHIQSRTTPPSHAPSASPPCCANLKQSHHSSLVLVSTRQTKAMPSFPQPCTQCGQLTINDSLCEKHRREKNQAKEKARGARVTPERKAQKSQLYNYAYRKAAAQIRATATHCHICLQPFVEGDRIEADHLLAGSNEGGLAAAHRLCNQRRGARPL